MDVEVDSIHKIIVNSQVEIELPYSLRMEVVRDNLVILLLESWGEETPEMRAELANAFEIDPEDLIRDADFELENDEQNVLALDSEGDIVWVIPEPSQDNQEEGQEFYKYLVSVNDKVYTRHQDGHIYKIDPENGELLDRWPHNYLPLGENLVELEGRLSSIVEFDDYVCARFAESSHDLYLFAKDGTEIWRSQAQRGAPIKVGDELWERVQIGRENWKYYRLDLETGDRIDERTYEEMWH